MNVGISSPDIDVEKCEPKVVPFGAIPWLFEKEKRVFDGGSFDKDSNYRLVMAIKYGRYTILCIMTTSFQNISISALITNPIHWTNP